MPKTAGRRSTRSDAAERTPAPPADGVESAGDAIADAAIAESHDRNPKPPLTIVHRVDPDTGKKKYCVEAVTDLVTPAFIGKRFGGGQYSLTHRKAVDGGRYVYAGHDTVEIDESVKPEAPATAAPEPEAHATGDDRPASPSGGSIIDRAMEAGLLSMIQQMNNQNQLTLAMVERIMKADDRPRGPSILEIVAALGPTVGPILVELAKRRGKDPLELATQLATLVKDKNAPGPDAMLSALEKGINLATKLGADRAGGGEGMMPVIGAGVELLSNIVGNIMAQRRGQVPPGDASPAPTAPLALVPDHDPGSAMPDRLWITAARPHLPKLLTMHRYVPAVSAAEIVASNLTPQQLNDLLEDIQDESPPGFAQRLTLAFPAAADVNPTWFGELIQTLLDDQLGPEDEDEPARPPRAANK